MLLSYSRKCEFAGELVFISQRAQFFPSRIFYLDAVTPSLLLAQIFDLAGIEHAF